MPLPIDNTEGLGSNKKTANTLPISPEEGVNKIKAINYSSLIEPPKTEEPPSGKKELPTEGVNKIKAINYNPLINPSKTEEASSGKKEPPTEEVNKPKTITYSSLIKPSKTEEAPSGEKHNTNLAEITDVVMKMAKGELTDNIYQKHLNNYISNIVLYGQADTEAIYQQIAQDPNLRGTGLGYALLAQASREANFDISKQLSQLSVDSAERLLQIQKFGIQQGAHIDTLNDERRRADIQSMANMGQWGAVADMMNESLAQTFPGLELSVSEESLAARDPFTIERVNFILNTVREIAKTQPDTATAMVQSLMDDPEMADLFGEGMTAEGFVEAIITGQIEQAQIITGPAYTAINSEAAIDGSYYDVQDQYKILSDNGRRKGFIDAGRNLSLERVNELRMGEGLPEWDLKTFEAAALDDDEMEELGQLDHFYRTKTEGKSQTKRKALIEALKNTSFFVDWLKDDNQEALDALYAWADMIEFNPNVSVTEDGQVVFEGEDVNLPWLQRENYHIFYDWPIAFDDNGNELPPENIYWGNRPLTPELKDGLTDKKKLKDDELDEKWRNYLAANGTLSAREWYFASAGGKYKINEEGFNENRIPSNLKNKIADLPEDIPEELLPPIPSTITNSSMVSDLNDGGLNEDSSGIKTEFGTFATPALPSTDLPSKVYETLRQNADKLEIPPGAEARNLEDIIYLMERRVNDIDKESTEILQSTGKRIHTWTRDIFKKEFDIDLGWKDTIAAFFPDFGITREGRAMEMFLMMIKDLNMDTNSAYAMAANLIGTDRLDAAFKKLTGKTYGELRDSASIAAGAPDPYKEVNYTNLWNMGGGGMVF